MIVMSFPNNSQCFKSPPS